MNTRGTIHVSLAKTEKKRPLFFKSISFHHTSHQTLVAIKETTCHKHIRTFHVCFCKLFYLAAVLTFLVHVNRTSSLRWPSYSDFYQLISPLVSKNNFSADSHPRTGLWPIM